MSATAATGARRGGQGGVRARDHRSRPAAVGSISLTRPRAPQRDAALLATARRPRAWSGDDGSSAARPAGRSQRCSIGDWRVCRAGRQSAVAAGRRARGFVREGCCAGTAARAATRDRHADHGIDSTTGPLTGEAPSSSARDRSRPACPIDDSSRSTGQIGRGVSLGRAGAERAFTAAQFQRKPIASAAGASGLDCRPGAGLESLKPTGARSLGVSG